MGVTLKFSFLVRAFQVIGYILRGFLVLYIAAKSLTKDIIAISGLIFVVIMVQLEHLLFNVLFSFGSIL